MGAGQWHVALLKLRAGPLPFPPVSHLDLPGTVLGAGPSEGGPFVHSSGRSVGVGRGQGAYVQEARHTRTDGTRPSRLSPRGTQTHSVLGPGQL